NSAMMRFKTQYDCKTVTVIDGKGREHPLGENKSYHVSTSKIIKAVMLGILNEVTEGGVPKADTALLEAEAAFSTLSGQSSASLIEDIIANLGMVIPQFLGSINGYTYWNVIKTPQGKASHVFLAGWEFDPMIRFYLKRFMSRKPQDDGTELLSVERKPEILRSGGAKGQNQKLNWSLQYKIIPNKPISDSLKAFVLSLFKTGRIDHGIIQYKGSPCLVTGMPGVQMQNFLIFSLKPLRPIKEEIAALKSRLILFGFLSVGFTSFLVMLLAKKFLKPIQELSLGIDAVREKDFRYVIPQQDKDELGDLANHFNRMMESLQEMSFGSQVQNQLFPKEPLCHGEYRVFGLSLPATELGGDYFDYLVFSGNKLFVLTGDVTG
ncbi:HAMP domain-containing protein, partial [bacterium]|nr:HAMP domain-containing protein [bacterium]